MLKTQLQAQCERPAARQFVVKIERVEVVVLAGEVEQTERDFGFSTRKTITDKRVELLEVSARFTTAVVLTIPLGLFPGKETAGMIVNRRQTHLLQNPLGSLTWYYWIFNI